MGLDMYAYALNAEAVGNQQVDLEIAESEPKDELFYWRKHHDLHGWMHHLYAHKGGLSPDFNLNTVRLTADDLDELERAVQGKALPATTGFFFGNFPPDDESIEMDMKFITQARQAIADGKAVIYDSWW
ncbi:hypothetical protein UFOVP26_37 [uncultured Caudovirales phage]|uniref:Uncharacterized protein n=1 Tax=uncultured Caudovirales phage TaxID=2100421 RepID=A0A6J5KNU7_9CAUD|nr:hypothetical protein UFOVP26_37 [uncultured Caudovirales phage]CAB4123812.1 hypothetical protein UFOVP44_60 [uncultured Caudovirales phage]CAB5219242.1 hypothetical protein UFOVP220_51 [uncultured Caudovirales phage]